MSKEELAEALKELLDDVKNEYMPVSHAISKILILIEAREAIVTPNPKAEKWIYRQALKDIMERAREKTGNMAPLFGRDSGLYMPSVYIDDLEKIAEDLIK